MLIFLKQHFVSMFKLLIKRGYFGLNTLTLINVNVLLIYQTFTIIIYHNPLLHYTLSM